MSQSGSIVLLNELLRKNQSPILQRWFDLILETYPPDGATLMRKDRDPFTNPVGSTISREIGVIFQRLCEGAHAEAFQASLDSVLKIRSVQNFTPSQAVGFVFLLKKAIEETLKGEIQKPEVLGEWLNFQSKIDDLGLQAFDIYVDCREKICEIKVNRAQAEKKMALRMMERMTYSKKREE
jgi:hypothetical protein